MHSKAKSLSSTLSEFTGFITQTIRHVYYGINAYCNGHEK